MAAKKKVAGKKKVAASKEASAAAIALKRSKAARKGWATRRKNVVKKKARNNKKILKNAQLGLPKKKRKVIPELALEGKTKKELIEIVRAQNKDIGKITWVDAMPSEFLSSIDGTITLYPSRARHLGPDTDYILDELHSLVYGSPEFDDRCTDFADEYDMTVQEIYTLFWSP